MTKLSSILAENLVMRFETCSRYAAIEQYSTNSPDLKLPV